MLHSVHYISILRVLSIWPNMIEVLCLALNCQKLPTRMQNLLVLIHILLIKQM